MYCVVLSIVLTVYASICNASIHVASMSILYSVLAMHLLLSVKHGMVPHLVHDASHLLLFDVLNHVSYIKSPSKRPVRIPVF